MTKEIILDLFKQQIKDESYYVYYFLYTEGIEEPILERCLPNEIYKCSEYEYLSLKQYGRFPSFKKR